MVNEPDGTGSARVPARGVTERSGLPDPVTIHVNITIAVDQLTADFAKSSPQMKAGIYSPITRRNYYGIGLSKPAL